MKKKIVLSNLKKDYSSFSKSFRKIIDFIMHNQNIISFISINQLAKDTKTSPATVTRFSKKLGFKGYPDFQKIFQYDVEMASSQMREFSDEMKNLADSRILGDIISTNIELLEEIEVGELDKKIDEAIEIINRGKKLFILGARGSYILAYYVYFMIKELRKDVELVISGASDFTDKLVHSTKDDVLFALSFHPYTFFTCQVTEFFKEQGSRVISMTDKDDSVLGNLSNLVLTTKNGGKSYSFVPGIVILNALILKFAKLNEKKSLKKLNKVKEINEKFNIYKK